MPAARSALSTLSIPPRERLIAALDVPSAEQARQLVRSLGDAVHFYKLGFELLMSGDYFRLVDELSTAGKKLFLDLKLYDIPETVGRALRSLRERPVHFVTVHYDRRVLEAALRECGAIGILAVTVMTSIDAADLRDHGFRGRHRSGRASRSRGRRARSISAAPASSRRHSKRRRSAPRSVRNSRS